METFGERLRRLRTQRTLSLDDLAGRTGISKAYLWRLETNPDVNPSVDVAQKIATALEVTIGALLVSSEPTAAAGYVDIPPTLRAAQVTFNIPEEDVLDLANIRFRGGQPITAEDWALLYLQLKRTTTGD